MLPTYEAAERIAGEEERVSFISSGVKRKECEGRGRVQSRILRVWVLYRNGGTRVGGRGSARQDEEESYTPVSPWEVPR